MLLRNKRYILVGLLFIFIFATRGQVGAKESWHLAYSYPVIANI